MQCGRRPTTNILDPLRRAIRHTFLLLSFLALPASVQALDKVRLQLRFDHQFQFAGYYAAQWQGYYAEAGLEVEIMPGVRADRTMVIVPDVVGRGGAEFGIGAGDVLLAIDRGVPLRVVASILQQSPVELFARRGVQLNSPADLTRLTVLQDASPLVRAEIYAMLQAEGLGPETVHFLHPLAGLSVLDRIQNLLDGKVDVMPGFAFSIPWYAKEQGIELTSLKPSTYGVDFYGDSLFTTAALIERDPDLVKRFRDASIEGWHYVLEHPESVIERIVDDLPRELPVADLAGYNRFLANKTRVLMNYPIIEIGHVNPRRWQHMHDALFAAGMVRNPLSLDDLVFNPEKVERVRLQQILKYTIEIAAFVILAGGAVFVLYLVRAKRRVEESARRYRGLFDDSPLSIWEEDLSAVKTYLEQQLAEQSLPVREFLQQHPEVVEDCARRVRIVDVNKATLRLYGASSKEEMLNVMPDTFTPESYQVFREELIALIEGATDFNAEATVMNLAGQPLHIDIRLSILPESRARWERVVVLIADLSERKQVEAMLNRYSLMASVTEDMMAYVDSEYRYRAVNEGYAIAFRREKEDIVGSTVEELIGADMFRSLVKPNMDRCLTGKTVSYDMEIHLPGNGQRYLKVNYYPVIASTGKVEGIVVHLHDQTEIKQLELKLIDHQSNLEQLVASRTEKLSQALQELESFSYSVSHDLRAPLRSINGFSTALLEDCRPALDEVGRDYLERIIRNVHKMEEQIDGLLSLSRITRGEMQPQHFDLSPIVRELAEKYQLLYPERLFDLKIALSVEVYGDRRLLEIALDNLIGNAFKFSSRETAPCIEFGQTERDGQPAIYVRDNGIGFDMQYADKLFTVFQRLHADIEGHGIGLAIVQRVVVRHGGRLSAESAPGQGATFYIHMPPPREVAEFSGLGF